MHHSLSTQNPWQELIERPHSPSRGDVMHLEPAPNTSDPFHKQGTGGWPGWAPGMTTKLFERTGANRGRPGEANQTHQIVSQKQLCHWLQWFTGYNDTLETGQWRMLFISVFWLVHHQAYRPIPSMITFHLNLFYIHVHIHVLYVIHMWTLHANE